ncbi:MAG: hypothetical protein PHY80_04215 [Rickettsiales bacterium]|jgi:succinate dehydrogenase hydrophobic anchor subunit|nr:hypothetical protein [Rickettsiales bacterium]
MMSEDKKALTLSRHGISGLVLLPLLTWFLISFFYIISDPVGYLPIFFYSPINAIFGMFFVVIVLYHLDFDVKYIVEHSKIGQNAKNLFMLFFDFLSIIITVSAVLSILQLHFMGIFIA